jgi:hypothetical protein
MPEQAERTAQYLPEIECEARKGDADWEVVVTVEDEAGKKQSLSVSKGLVTKDGDKTYLAVGVVRADLQGGRVLVELPREADSGVNRLWVPLASFRQRRRA